MRISLALALLVLVCTARLPAEAQTVEERATIRLRLEWGGTQLRTWNGVLEVSEGRLTEPASLGMEADEAGTIWADRTALWIQRRSKRAYDGFDVTLDAARTATLNLTLQSVGDPTVREQVSIPVGNLLGEEHYSPLGTDGDRLVVRRVPGDELRVQFPQSHLIFEPGSAIPLSLEFRLFSKARQTIRGRLKWRVTEGRSDRTIGNGTAHDRLELQSGIAKKLPIAIELPEQEGVYKIHFEFNSRDIPNIHRQVQCVVYANHVGRPTAGALTLSNHKLVDQFQPGRPGMFRAVGSTRTTTRLPNPFESLSGIVARQPIDSKQAESKAQWRAYHLNVRHPEQPHELVVRLPTGVGQALGMSLLEPNAADQLLPNSLDSGVRIDANDFGQTSQTIEHRMLVWPRTEKPIVLFHQLEQSATLQIDDVSLHEVEFQRGALDEQFTKHSHAKRLIGPYLNKPLLPENFGGTEVLDETNGRSLDDWETFFDSGQRMAQYLRAHNFNSMMLAVFADGSTIYPSELLAPNSRYDTGGLSSNRLDPVRKDVLEFLFRVFDREGIALVPELQFSTPLPQLEALKRRTESRVSGIEPIGAEGRSWLEVNGTTRGTGSYYNPLQPAVQDAIADVVAELVDRYRTHPSYRGVAVELSSLSYLLLPGLEWGYDDATIARFEQQTGLSIPNEPGESRFAQRHRYLTGLARTQWIAWRCEQIAALHRRLAKIVANSHDGAKLVLAGKHVLRTHTSGSRLQTAIREGERLSDLLSEIGLDLNQHSDNQSIVVLRPYLETTQYDEFHSAIDKTTNSSPSLDAAFKSIPTGGLLYQLPREKRIPDFDAIAPWQPAYTWLVSHAQQTGPGLRAQFANPLASLDAQIIFSGGWMVPLGQEAATSQIRKAICQLPAIPFELVPEQSQPAVIRMARTESHSYLYVVNDFPKPTEVTLTLSSEAGTAMRVSGGPDDEIYRFRADNHLTVTFSLEAYGVIVCQMDDPSARLTRHNVRVENESLKFLADRLGSFERKIAIAQSQQTAHRRLLNDPGFESHGQGQQKFQLTDWSVVTVDGGPRTTGSKPTTPSVRNATHWSLDQKNPRSGENALRLSSTSGGAVLLSPPLPLNGQTYLSFSLWLRSDAAKTPIRLSLVGDLTGEPFSQSVEIEAEPQWQRFIFRVKEMPATGLTHARLRVESFRPGQIWLDDVDLQLQQIAPNDFRQLTKSHAALALAWEEKRYADCHRLLQGYWGQYLSDVDLSTAPVDSKGTSTPKPAELNNEVTQPKASLWRRLFGRK